MSQMLDVYFINELGSLLDEKCVYQHLHRSAHKGDFEASGVCSNQRTGFGPEKVSDRRRVLILSMICTSFISKSRANWIIFEVGVASKCVRTASEFLWWGSSLCWSGTAGKALQTISREFWGGCARENLESDGETQRAEGYRNRFFGGANPISR